MVLANWQHRHRPSTEAYFNCDGSAYVPCEYRILEEKRVSDGVRDITSCRSDEDDAQAPGHVARSLCLENHTISHSGGKVATPCL